MPAKHMKCCCGNPYCDAASECISGAFGSIYVTLPNDWTPVLGPSCYGGNLAGNYVLTGGPTLWSYVDSLYIAGSCNCAPYYSTASRLRILFQIGCNIDHQCYANGFVYVEPQTCVNCGGGYGNWIYETIGTPNLASSWTLPIKIASQGKPASCSNYLFSGYADELTFSTVSP